MTPNKIFLHHSLTKDSETVSWGAIWKYHVNTMGWSSVGYHFGVELINDRYQVLLGRMPSVQGAHTKGQNQDSIGICFVGNYDIEEPPREMWLKGLELVRWLQGVYRIWNHSIHGHREFADKTCPGTMFDVEKFKADLLNN